MKKLFLILSILLALLTIGQAKAQGLTGSGTTDDPYLISSNADWTSFAQSVTNGTTYAGQTVKLTADITATVMAGSHTNETNYHAFSGIFDGDGHTITLDLSGGGEGIALFSDLNGATLKNLKAQGSVTTNDRRPATFAIIVFGNSTISNCWSTVAVSSTRTSDWVDGGGFVGRVSSNATLNMTDCAFHGTVTFAPGATSGGGMIGFTQTNATVNLTNCLYSPSALTLNVNQYNPRIFVSGNVTGNLTNCYYNAVAAASVLENQGIDASGMTNEALAAALGEGWHVYNDLVVPFLGEYYISSPTEWNTFAQSVTNGKTYAGQIVKLTNNISVSTMVGVEDKCFAGTFNGQNHTITLNMTANGQYTSLFCFADGATFQNLKVDGTINTSRKFCASFVGAIVYNGCTFTNCVSDVTINSTINGDGTHGGFVGYAAWGDNTFEGCAFTGKLLGASTTNVGGFVGFTESRATVSFTNCVFHPQQVTMSGNGSQTFARWRSGNSSGVIIGDNCYYSQTLGAAQGKQMRSITAGEYVTVAFSGNATTYEQSGISAYAVGIVFGSILYAGDGETVSLNLGCTPPSGYSFNGFIASAGTLNGTGNPYTLTMPNENVTIQAVLVNNFIEYIDGDGNTHTCSNYTVLTGNEAILHGGWYVVNDDITYNRTLTLTDDVNLILCNGNTMTVSTINGSRNLGNGSLIVYGQNLNSDVAGTLNAGSTRYPQFNSRHTTSTHNGGINVINYTQHSGNVVASNNSSHGDALYANHFTMNGGTIIIPNNRYERNTYSGLFVNGNLVINGGKVEAPSIHAYDDITLGYTNTDDYILAGHYESEVGTIAVKSGQALYYEDDWGENVIVSGILDEDQIDAIGGKTLRPHFVNYMDGDGEMHYCSDYTVLTGEETTLTEGWYVVDDDITYNGILYLNGDVTLILGNSKTMTIGTNDIGNGGILQSSNNNDTGNLTVYGQSLSPDEAGTLNATHNRFPQFESDFNVITATPTGRWRAINVSNYTQHSGNVIAGTELDKAISADSFTINGGSIIATSNDIGIFTNGDMTINGGSINATCGDYGIFTNGDMTINGGVVTASVNPPYAQWCGLSGKNNIIINGGTVESDGIYTINNIILGFTKVSDHIHANYYTARDGTVSVKNGEAFYYENGNDTVVISDILTSEEIAAIGGKTLWPYIGPCTPPYNLEVTDIGPTEATLHWTGYSESYYVSYYYKTFFFDSFEEDLSQWTVFHEGDPESWEWSIENPHDNSTDLNAHSGYYAAVSYGDYDIHADNWLITPQIQFPNQTTLKFWIMRSTYDDAQDEYEVRLSTTGNAISDFTTILKEKAAANSYWTEVSIDLSEYDGQQGYIAIRHDYTDGFFIMVDDFGIFGWSEDIATTDNSLLIEDLLPETEYQWRVRGVDAQCEVGITEWSEMSFFTTLISCYPVDLLSYDNLTSFSVNLSWVLEDETQTAWQICLNGDESNLIDANTNEGFLLDGLEPNVEYTVKVRAYCDENDYSSWSDTVTFTTPEVCFTPKNLAANNITAVSADLSWTGREDVESYTVRYRTMAERTGEWITETTSETEAQLTDLDGGTTYEAQVRSDCNPDGWCNMITFTTLDENTKVFVFEGEWSDGDNWVPVGVPTIDNDVILRAEANVFDVAEANFITIDDAGALIIEDGGQLKTNADVEATMKKFVIGYGIDYVETDKGYYLMTLPTVAPISAADALLLTEESDYDLYSWDRTATDEEWQNNHSGIDLQNGVGFLYANRDDIEMLFTASLRNSSEPVVVTPSYDEAEYGGWNLCGNPFPCEAYITTEAEGMTFYRLVDNQLELFEGAISPMEGFFVKATAANQTFTISREAPAKHVQP